MYLVATGRNSSPVSAESGRKRFDIRNCAKIEDAEKRTSRRQPDEQCGAVSTSARNKQTMHEKGGNREGQAKHNVDWYFRSRVWGTSVNGTWCDPLVVRAREGENVKGRPAEAALRIHAEQSYELLAKQVASMTAEDAATLLPVNEEPLDSRKGKGKGVELLVLQVKTNSEARSHPLQGFYIIPALPASSGRGAL
ncbi:hypothetical protein EBH_0084130 [Eimeria brunetti]|uniref:Uncharacterized protein n=1 Tax=Eimeria brunetti TaxID=51314 RepID=U6M016_9EIME|nr:hypothetical protein EBH_0084130 [Eimeria brunetti]